MNKGTVKAFPDGKVRVFIESSQEYFKIKDFCKYCNAIKNGCEEKV